MGSIGQTVYIIAYNVNSSPRGASAVLLIVGPAVQASERRTGGAGAGRRDRFGLLLLCFRVTLPSFPFYVGLDAVLLVSVWFRSGWFAGVGMGAMVFYWILLPAGFSRSRRYGCFSRARVVIMRRYALYTLAAFYAYFAGVVHVLGCSLVGLGVSW